MNLSYLSNPLRPSQILSDTLRPSRTLSDPLGPLKPLKPLRGAIMVRGIKCIRAPVTALADGQKDQRVSDTTLWDR